MLSDSVRRYRVPRACLSLPELARGRAPAPPAYQGEAVLHPACRASIFGCCLLPCSSVHVQRLWLRRASGCSGLSTQAQSERRVRHHLRLVARQFLTAMRGHPHYLFSRRRAACTGRRGFAGRPSTLEYNARSYRSVPVASCSLSPGQADFAPAWSVREPSPLYLRVLFLVPSQYRFSSFGWKKCSASYRVSDPKSHDRRH